MAPHATVCASVVTDIIYLEGNNLNIPCLPDPGKFRGMNTKLILYTKSFILNVVKESRVARQARHSVSFLRSLVTMAVTRPRFCPPHSSSAPLLMAVTNAPNVLTLSGSNLVKANAKWSKSQIMVHHQTSKSSHFPSRRPPISVRNLKSSIRAFQLNIYNASQNPLPCCGDPIILFLSSIIMIFTFIFSPFWNKLSSIKSYEGFSWLIMRISVFIAKICFQFTP